MSKEINLAQQIDKMRKQAKKDVKGEALENQAELPVILEESKEPSKEGLIIPKSEKT